MQATATRKQHSLAMSVVGVGGDGHGVKTAPTRRMWGRRRSSAEADAGAAIAAAAAAAAPVDVEKGVTASSSDNGVPVGRRRQRLFTRTFNGTLPSSCDYDDGSDGECGSSGFESPLKAMKVNFRMNQLFGIFPWSISKDFLMFKFQPLILVWTYTLKFSLIALALFLIHVWLSDKGLDFEDFWNQALDHKAFSRTDYFAIIAHYVFLQTSAQFIFFVNLKLGRELTRAIPSAKKIMTYRYFVCFLCTVASILYLCGIHRIIKTPETTFLDWLIIAVMAFALYIENQNHMFTELLFLRFLSILKYHFTHTLDHLKRPHAQGARRACCYNRCRTLHTMFKAINYTFGTDLLITILILVISISIGIYLALTFLVFVGDHGEHLLFILAYLLYATVPSLRLYVIVEGSETIRDEIKNLRCQIDIIESDILCSDTNETRISNRSSFHGYGAPVPSTSGEWELAKTSRSDLAMMRLVSKLFSEITNGFSISGFFFLNRGIITSLIGSLVTYLIVLLQFKVSDLSHKELDEIRKATD